MKLFSFNDPKAGQNFFALSVMAALFVGLGILAFVKDSATGGCIAVAVGLLIGALAFLFWKSDRDEARKPRLNLQNEP